ncbi:MAG: sugar ABC transporter permease, partial [Lachnospiraceae bacterium]|nr:sugar ABC transporter permease [Lachnospiraceae bacterium]
MKKRSESISRIISKSKEVEKVARKKKQVQVEKKPFTKEDLWIYVKRYWQLYLLLLLPMIYFLVFKYSPMYYILIAFKKYSIVQKVSEMPWAKNHGFEYFLKAFKNKDFINALRNTVFLNLFDIIVGFPVPIIFALLLNELRFKFFKKTVQTVAYMPHFLSWVIIYGLAMQLFSPTNGFVNMLITKLGGEAVHFLDDPNKWVGTYIGLGVWQSFGWNSIIYLAAISGISPELYEAASVDGANRFQKMWHITLPGIRPTIVVL